MSKTTLLELEAEKIEQKFEEIVRVMADGHVTRWHVVPHHGQQTTAEHSARALSLLLMLYPGDPSIALVRAVLWHDCTERVLGDLPATAKRDFRTLQAAYTEAEMIVMMSYTNIRQKMLVDDIEKAWLKAVDTLELILWAHDQAMLGSEHGYILMERGGAWLRDNPDTPNEVLEFLDYVIDNRRLRSLV